MGVKRAEGDAPAFWRANEDDEWQEATIYIPRLPHLHPDYQTPQTWPPGEAEKQPVFQSADIQNTYGRMKGGE